MVDGRGYKGQQKDVICNAHAWVLPGDSKYIEASFSPISTDLLSCSDI